MEWISVKDGFPADNWAKPLADYSGMQLVYNSTGVISMAFYNRIDERWYTDCPAECVEWIDKTTHWMPLPEPPKG